MKKFVFLLFVLFSFTLAKASVKDSIGVTKKDGKFHVKYLVSPGETIYGISTRYGVSISTLMEINPELENGLKVGQVVLIPYNETYMASQQEAESNVNQQVHVVKSGETLYSLSKKYNVSIGDLLKWNGMELKAGQKLVVGYTQDDDSGSQPIGDVGDPVNKEDPEYVKDTLEPNLIIKNVIHNKYDYDEDLQQVLIVPFDPHLYFSDADDEIAAVSKIHRTKVREVFRRRLNTLLDPPGYETIWLLGGEHRDTLADLNKVYSTVQYNYQEVLYSDYIEQNIDSRKGKDKNGIGGWIKTTKMKIKGQQANPHTKDHGKYFGVKIKDPAFFEYFNQKYSIDYYIFINQFEVVTDYENCLDRAANNFSRHFVTHFSIFDKEGNQIAGNKFKTYYNSSSKYVMTIVADNVPQIAERILAELPAPKRPDPNAGE